jgi:hypothetical protein
MDHSNQVSSTTNSHADNRDGGDDVEMSDGAQQIREEIPFLVTHWLANFGKGGGTTTNNSSSSSSSNKNNNNNNNTSNEEAEQIAIAKIRRAASDIADAFTTLGAYGTTLRVSQKHLLNCRSISFPFQKAYSGRSHNCFNNTISRISSLLSLRSLR